MPLSARPVAFKKESEATKRRKRHKRKTRMTPCGFLLRFLCLFVAYEARRSRPQIQATRIEIA
jgi:hypothetical protein